MPADAPKTIALLLHPVDQLFFRDARPFGQRDTGHSALPTPQILSGMIKTHLMHTAGLNPGQLHGQHGNTAGHWIGRIRSRGPWLYRLQASRGAAPGPLVNMPANVVQGKSAAQGDASNLHCLLPLKNSPPGWQPPHDGMLPLWTRSPQQIRHAGGYIDHMGLRQYLLGESIPIQNIHQDDELFGFSDRTGIAIGPESAAAQEGMIYSTRMLALKPDVCFYAELELPHDAPPPDQLFSGGLALPWGGEGRRVRVEPLPNPFHWPFAPPDDGRMLSLLITPGIFSNAQYPWKPRERGALVAAAVPKPLPVSGWDLSGSAEAARAPGPKPTRFAVPAGAVYFWNRSDRKDAPGTPNGPPVVDCLTDRPRDADAGWGLALCGTWKFFPPPA
jgi:CRISPR-associated protein Cmr3